MNPIGTILEIGNKLIDRVFPDPIQNSKAKIELLNLQQSGDLATIAEQSKIIVAEAQSESWIARNWRPLIMLLFGVILLNNYILVPWLKTFGLPVAMMDIPPNMWHLLELGMGGYIISRGFEKVTKNFKYPVNK